MHVTGEHRSQRLPSSVSAAGSEHQTSGDPHNDVRHSRRGAYTVIPFTTGIALGVLILSIIAAGVIVLRPDLVTSIWSAMRAFWPDAVRRSLIITAIVNLNSGAAALALLLTMLSFMTLGGIELLAVHGMVRRKTVATLVVPARDVLRTSFLAYAVSHCVGGFAASMAIRMRLYTRRGWPATDIVKVIAMCSAGTWAGAVLVMLVATPVVGATIVSSVTSTLRHLAASHPPGRGEIAIASLLACVAVIAAVVSFLTSRARRQSVPKSVPTPASCSTPTLAPAGTSFFTSRAMRMGTQALLAACDWIFCATILFVLLPHGSVSFALCVAVFVVANAAGAITHSPGGIGALDVTVLVILGPLAGAVPTAAALAWYRAIYYGAPLVIAGGVLVVPTVTDGLKRIRIWPARPVRQQLSRRVTQKRITPPGSAEARLRLAPLVAAAPSAPWSGLSGRS